MAIPKIQDSSVETETEDEEMQVDEYEEPATALVQAKTNVTSIAKKKVIVLKKKFISSSIKYRGKITRAPVNTEHCTLRYFRYSSSVTWFIVPQMGLKALNPLGRCSLLNTSKSTFISTSRCSCSGGCVPMPVVRECVCCKQIHQVVQKMDSYPHGELNCITAHPGFQTVCLDQDVMETAYYRYRQQYGGQAR